MSLAETFGRSDFARFINSPAGRWTRIVAGVALLVLGYTQRASVLGIVLVVLGIIPLVAGSLDWCLISALLRGPISGAVLRKRNQEHA